MDAKKGPKSRTFSLGADGENRKMNAVVFVGETILDGDGFDYPVSFGEEVVGFIEVLNPGTAVVVGGDGGVDAGEFLSHRGWGGSCRLYYNIVELGNLELSFNGSDPILIKS